MASFAPTQAPAPAADGGTAVNRSTSRRSAVPAKDLPSQDDAPGEKEAPVSTPSAPVIEPQKSGSVTASSAPVAGQTRRAGFKGMWRKSKQPAPTLGPGLVDNEKARSSRASLARSQQTHNTEGHAVREPAEGEDRAPSPNSEKLGLRPSRYPAKESKHSLNQEKTRQPWKKPDATEAWNYVTNTMKEYDDTMVEGWKDELGNLLIFAGLFSAVVTAFNIESYKLLKEDSQDRSVLILERISLQLSSLSVNSAFINSTTPAITTAAFKVTPTNVAINALWFISLSLALVAALFAIIALGWIRYYKDLSHVSGSKRARIRQARFDALEPWFIPQIIIGLDVLIQAALIVFFVGLMMLLWTINHTMAIIIICISTPALIVYLLTATLPIFIPDCPYKSPLAWLFNATVCWALTPAVVVMSYLLTSSNRAQMADPEAPWMRNAVEHLRLPTGAQNFLKRLRGLLRFVKFFRNRINYTSLLQLEDRYYERFVRNERQAKQHSETEMRQIMDVIKWTTETSSEKPLTYLAPCLLSLDVLPYEALCLWVKHRTGSIHEDMPTVQDLIDDLNEYDDQETHLAQLGTRARITGQRNQVDDDDSEIIRRDVDDHGQRQSEDNVSMALLVQACHRAADFDEIDEVGDRLSDVALWLRDRSLSSDELTWSHLSYLARVLHPKLCNPESTRSMAGVVDFFSIVVELFVSKPRSNGATCLREIVKSGWYRWLYLKVKAKEALDDGLRRTQSISNVTEPQGDRQRVLPSLLSRAFELVAIISLIVEPARFSAKHPTQSGRQSLTTFLRGVELHSPWSTETLSSWAFALETLMQQVPRPHGLETVNNYLDNMCREEENKQNLFNSTEPFPLLHEYISEWRVSNGSAKLAGVDVRPAPSRISSKIGDEGPGQLWAGSPSPAVEEPDQTWRLR